MSNVVKFRPAEVHYPIGVDGWKLHGIGDEWCLVREDNGRTVEVRQIASKDLMELATLLANWLLYRQQRGMK